MGEFIIERMIVISAAFLLDIILGDPSGWWHPVRGIGKLIECTEKLLRRMLHISDERECDRRKKRIAGAVQVIIVVCISTGLMALVLYAAHSIHPYLRVGVESVICYQMLAMKSLRDESMKVYDALRGGDIERARYAVSMIVGRDTEKLTGEGITKAAVETVAENTSDGIIAPLLYMLLFGACGGVFYKSVNTMDSMTGYKNDRYIYFGTVAAKTDDVVNYIPARISALLMIAASAIHRLDYKNAWKIFRRDRYNHASPNSAQTEAVCAGALSVQLAGDAYYFGRLYKKPTIGDAVRNIEAEDIRRVNRMMYTASIIMYGVGMLVMYIFVISIY